MLRTLSLAAALAVAGTAQAGFVGGGVVTQSSWSTTASNAYGMGVTVYRLYAAFSGNSTTDDTVNSVFNANMSAGGTLAQVGAPFGGNIAPNSGFFGFAPTLQWDSYVSIGLLTDTTTVGGDGNGINFTPDGLGGNSGWFNSSPPNLIGRAVADASFGTGLFLVFLGQFTVIDGGRAAFDMVDIRTDGSFGDGGGMFSGGMSLGINSQTTPSVSNIQFVPTPGAVALFGLAGLTAARRRRG